MFVASTMLGLTLPGVAAQTFDTTPPFTDSNYHEYLLYDMDTTDIDAIIMPPAGPLTLRDLQLLKQSVQAWDAGIDELAPAWLRDGLDIDVYILGLDYIPPEVLWDPEIIILTAEPYPLLRTFVGAGLEPIGFVQSVIGTAPYVCHGQPLPDPQAIMSNPGFHQHPGSSWGSKRQQCDNGGSTCFVVNTNWFDTGSPANLRDMYDLNSHEVGHCLGIGHVGDAGDFSAAAYPRDDIMSYENDGHNPAYVLCPSTLNMRALEYTYAHLLGQVPHRSTQGRYVHMVPSDWAKANCPQPIASPTDTGPILAADPLGLKPRDDEPGTPGITITQPIDGAEVAASLLTVEGFVDRDASTTPALGAAITADSKGNVGAPIQILGEAFGGNSAAGYTCAWQDDSGVSTYGNAAACSTTVTFANEGTFTLTLTVDDGTSTAEDTHEIAIEIPSGLPQPDGSIAGGITIFTEANPILAHNEALNLATQEAGDPAPKFLPGEPVTLHTRFTLDSTRARGPNGDAFTWHVWSSDGMLVDTVACSTTHDSSTTEIQPRNDDFDCPAAYTMPSDFGRYYTTLRSDLDGRFSCHNGKAIVGLVPYTGPACLKAFDVGVRDDLNPTGGSSVTPPSVGRVAGVGGDESCVLTIIQDNIGDVGTQPGSRDIVNMGAGEDAVNWYVCFEVRNFSERPGTSPLPGGDQTRYSFSWTAPYEALAPSYSARAVYNRDGTFASGTYLKGYAGVSSGALGGTIQVERNGNVVKLILPKAQIGAPADGVQATSISATSGDNGQGNGNQFDRAPNTGVVAYTFGSGRPLTADAGGPYQGSPGSPIPLTGTFSGGDGSAVCSWSTADDGTFTNGASCAASVTFATTGSKTVTLTVTDGTGSKSDNADVTVTEGPAGERVDVYLGADLLGTQSVTTGGETKTAPFSIEIDLNGYAGSATLVAKWYDDEDNLLAIDEVDIEIADAPTHTLAITSHEDGAEVPDGATMFEGHVIRAGGTLGTPATADITQSSQTGDTGATLTFDATVGGNPAPTCQWTFDGAAGSATFTTPTNSCTGVGVRSSAPETVTVRFAASNAHGSASDTATATWTDPGTPLTANAGGPYAGIAGAEISIVGSASGGQSAAGFTCAWSTHDDGAFSDPARCETTVSFATAGAKNIQLTVDDGTDQDVDAATVGVDPDGALKVRIESPTEGATVTQKPLVLSGSTTGTGDGAWVPLASRASTHFPSVGSLEPTVREQAGLFWEPWMENLENRLRQHDGFLGLVPSTWTGVRSVDAYYAGAAPLAVHDLVLPNGLVLLVHEQVTAKTLAYRFDDGFDVRAHRTLLRGAPLPDTGPITGPPHAYEPFLPDTGLWNTGIGPGAPTLQFMNADYDGNGLQDIYGCTANFLWKDQNGKLYLGLAGHCVLPFGEDADRNAMGPSGFDTSTVDVEVCVADCITGGMSGGLEDIFLGNYVALGRVAYARQVGPGSGGLFGLGGGGPGNDFALVEIPESLWDQLDPSMPVWGGPVDQISNPPAGLLTQIHGNSIVYGETFAGKSRLGVSMGRDGAGVNALGNQIWGNSQGYWMAMMPGESGDSGSAVNTLLADAGLIPGLDEGRGAGILTHGIGPWNILTKTNRAVTMALEAGLCIALVPGHVDPTDFPPPAAQEGVCESEFTGPEYDVQYSLDGGATWTSVDAFDPAARTWSATIAGIQDGPATGSVRLLANGSVVATHAVSFTIDLEDVETCGGAEGVLVATDPGDDGTGAAAGEALCLGARELAGGWFQLQGAVADASAVPGGSDSFYYDFFLTPSWTGATRGIWMYATWDGEEFGPATWTDRDALLPFQILGDPLRPADLQFRWLNDDPASGVVVAEFPLSNFASPPGPGDSFEQMGFGPNTYNDVDGTDYLDCVAGTNTGIDCTSRTGTYTFGAQGSAASHALPLGLAKSAAFGPQTGQGTEHVELYLNGVLVGSQEVLTNEDQPSALWTIPADLPEGANTIDAEWFDAGGTFLANATVRVTGVHLNEPPTAIIIAPGFAEEGQEVVFDATSSTDPDDDPLTYLWDFGDGTTSEAAIATHAFVGGTYTVTLTVTDDDGADDTATHEIHVNIKPVAVIAGPATANEGDVVSFSGAESSDADGEITSYTWDLGDGTFATGANVEHTYTPGEYVVTLTVEDNHGSVGTTSHALSINAVPVATIAGPTEGNRVTAASFDGSGSHDPDGTIVDYQWDFGDGETATGATVEHLYHALGTYTVTLTVVDDDGATATASHEVTIINLGPTATIEGDSEARKNKDVDLTAEASTDPDGTIVAYAWDFGDGETGSGTSVTHRYKKDGVYEVVVTVTDSDGATARATHTVTVSKDPPKDK